MNKFDFLTQLRAKLWNMPHSDVERTVDYYREMIEDRMEDGLPEEEAVAAVGDLNEIVEQLNAESPRTPAVVNAEPETQNKKQEKQRHFEPWMIVLLVLGSPVWMALLIAAAAVIFAVFVSLWAVVISLYATAFALAVSALGLLVGAFSLLWIRRLAECAVTVGGALVCAGVAILLFLLSNLAAKGLVALTKLIWSGTAGIFKRKERTA